MCLSAKPGGARWDEKKQVSIRGIYRTLPVYIRARVEATHVIVAVIVQSHCAKQYYHMAAAAATFVDVLLADVPKVHKWYLECISALPPGLRGRKLQALDAMTGLMDSRSIASVRDYLQDLFLFTECPTSCAYPSLPSELEPFAAVICPLTDARSESIIYELLARHLEDNDNTNYENEPAQHNKR